MIPVEIVDIVDDEMVVLHRGCMSDEDFTKFKLVKSPDGVVRITDLVRKNAIPEFVKAISLEPNA